MTKPKILVVEDEGISAKLIESTLRALNYDVPAVVATGEEAIGKAGEIRPDLVLMDIVLKGKIDGIQAAEQIHHQLGIPVVYLTAHSDDATLERAKIAEPFGYLVKPFQSRELQSTIAVALYKHQMEKRLKESEERARRIALQNSALAEIGRIISSTPKIKDIYDQFAAAAKGLIPFDRVAINLFDYETRSFSLAYASGEKIPGFEMANRHPLKGSINQKMIENRSPILLTPKRFEDIESEYPSIRGRWQAGFRSYLSAPLISGDHVIGGLHLLSRKHAAYTERDLGLIQRIADQIAGAIANAQLYTNLSKTEAALRESEQKYRRIIDTAQEGIWVIDENIQTTFVNARLAKMLGYTPEEMISQSTYSFMFQEDWADHKTKIQERREGKADRYERRFRRKDGGTLWVIISATPILDESGQFQGSISMVTDITDRKQAEENLQRNQEAIMCRAREEETVAEIGRIIGSTLSVEEVYDRFAEEAKKLIPFERISINLLSEDRSTFFIPYVSGIPVPGRQPGDAYPAEASLSEDMLKHGIGIILNLEQRGEMLTRFPGLRLSFEAGFRSSLRIPLISKDQLFGILGIHSQTPNFYTEHHLRLAESIGAQISGAIANAKLFAHLEKTLEALQESEERYRTVVDALGQAGNAMVMLQDIGPKEGIIVSANEVAQKITGYSAEELGNLSWVDIVHPSMREMVLDRIRRRMREESMPGIYETLIRNKNGQEIPLELTATGCKIQGKPTLIGFFREITQRKLLESQLVQAQKLEAIGQLAAGIAHEINTPIQYVGDNTRFFKDAFRDLNLLLQKYEELHQAVHSGTGTDGLMEEIQTLCQKVDPDYLVKEIPKAIQQTLEGVDRVANIVRAMKEFSHPGIKEKSAVNLNRAIENTITVARNEWKYVAEMETDLDPSLPPIPCFPGEVNQVFLNMIINAAHAIADALGSPSTGKGKITIRTRHDDRFAEVRIRDTGTGIPPEIQTRIFDPFFTTKQVGKGTGQGLAIAHSVIVKKHGGTIHFQTEVGQGTTFIIRLPLIEGSEAGSHPPEKCEGKNEIGLSPGEGPPAIKVSP